ncbi:hypothetical protein E0E52_13005 [Azotobacter chroococcum]|uniref:hypothetical protein n=1 Tax=Azotobacter chroococcum TaxID=353 RepID=UPI00103C85EC|nr:hypothetical protein [Azotobacter chroococcum]TBW04260.1 hypothetical protein E0E52_13005 [Azotobacter chroococcum]
MNIDLIAKAAADLRFIEHLTSEGGPYQLGLEDVTLGEFARRYAEWIERSNEGKPVETTLDDLADRVPNLDVPLQLLRRQRELAWESLEIAKPDREAALKEHRRLAVSKIIAAADTLEGFGIITPENADELRYAALDLHDDTPGKTSRLS